MAPSIHLKTHRFTFSDTMVNEITRFSKLHQHDDRHSFKDAWKTWIEEKDISHLIMTETQRMCDNGFQGDVQQKLYKSCRYYFRNKSTTPADNLPRKQYECIDKNTLRLMDQFIQTQFDSTPEKTNTVFAITPADSFNIFCANNQSMIVSYMKEHQTPIQMNANNNLLQYSKSQARTVMEKFKKIFKNRFYRIRVNLQNPTLIVD